MAEIIIKGKLPSDPSQRVLLIESAVQAVCQSVGEDPADGVMVLLTAAVHLHQKYSKKPLEEFEISLARALGYAIVAADGFFKLRPVVASAPGEPA